MFKEYRNKQNLTQEKLSNITNLDIRTIQRIENEERLPSIESLAKLILVLKIPDEVVLKYIKSFAKIKVAE